MKAEPVELDPSIDWEAASEGDGLKKFTMPVLKAFLKSIDRPVSGQCQKHTYTCTHSSLCTIYVHEGAVF